MTEYKSEIPEREFIRKDGREQARTSVDSDKLLNPQGAISSGSITKTMLKYETATLIFSSADTVKTTSITSGSVIFGFYVSAISGAPAFADLLLSISGTTLTGTRATAPGGSATITYTIVLMKA
jgi:hypothetical protein